MASASAGAEFSARIAGLDIAAAKRQAASAARDANWVYEPHVLVSDFDKALKAAARAQFPDTVKHQLCRWHILKNVAFNIKKKWIGSIDGTVIGESGRSPGSADPTPDLEAEAVEAEAEAIEAGAGQAGSHRTDELRDIASAARVATTLLDATRQPGLSPPGSSRKYLNNADGIMLAFRDCIYATSALDSHANWERLRIEFST